MSKPIRFHSVDFSTFPKWQVVVLDTVIAVERAYHWTRRKVRS